MKTAPTKAEKRESLNQEVERFLAQGGTIHNVEQGVSGRENPASALIPSLFDGKSQTRTDASDALKALDNRKKNNQTKTKPTRRNTRKKVPVYDDFGELLRWVWQE